MSLIETLLELVFTPPARCVLCRTGLGVAEKYVCSECLRSIKRVYQPTCPRCGRPMGALKVCLQCQNTRYHFSRARSWGIYEDKLREIIHLFKFNNKPYLGRLLAVHMVAELGLAQDSSFDVLVPVPLHPARLLRRGYNQSAILAELIAKAIDKPYCDALKRLRNTPPQTSLDRAARQKAVVGIFAVKRLQRSRVEAQRIMLVDDVFTTGSTLDECAKALLAAGAVDVQALTAATVI